LTSERGAALHCHRGAEWFRQDNFRARVPFGYAARLKSWKRARFRIEIVYLKLPSSRLALRRIAARVRQGGHGVPEADVRRRFARSWNNFVTVYRPLADVWYIYDNSSDRPKLVEHGP